ncbi:MAG: hypothetical protein ACJ8KU_10980 [Chthoniobacterales bacterium]
MDQTKPPMYLNGEDNALFDFTYEYDPSGRDGNKFWKLNATGAVDHYVVDTREAMSFACRSWGKAVGAWGLTQGAITGGAVDMASSAFGDANGFDTEHNAEFDRRPQQTNGFYKRLLDELGVPRNR